MSHAFPKTQFLVTDHGTYTTIKAYRRKRATVVVGPDDEPRWPMTASEFYKLWKACPALVEREGLRLVSVWTLVEIKS